MKWIATILLALSAFLFILTGGQEEMLIFPALSFAFLGLWVWENANSKARNSNPPALDPSTKEQLARVENLLLSMQDDLAQVREDRDFYQRLYGPEVRESLPPEIR